MRKPLELLGDVLDSKAGTVAVVGSMLAVLTGVDYSAGAIADASYGSAQAKQYLEQSGYKHPMLEDVGKFAVYFQGCSNTDQVAYTFEAQAPNGQDVQTLVCKGIFKGATIRQP